MAVGITLDANGAYIWDDPAAQAATPWPLAPVAPVEAEAARVTEEVTNEPLAAQVEAPPLVKEPDLSSGMMPSLPHTITDADIASPGLPHTITDADIASPGMMPSQPKEGFIDSTFDRAIRSSPHSVTASVLNNPYTTPSEKLGASLFSLLGLGAGFANPALAAAQQLGTIANFTSDRNRTSDPGAMPGAPPNTSVYTYGPRGGLMSVGGIFPGGRAFDMEGHLLGPGNTISLGPGGTYTDRARNNATWTFPTGVQGAKMGDIRGLMDPTSPQKGTEYTGPGSLDVPGSPEDAALAQSWANFDPNTMGTPASMMAGFGLGNYMGRQGAIAPGFMGSHGGVGFPTGPAGFMGQPTYTLADFAYGPSANQLGYGYNEMVADLNQATAATPGQPYTITGADIARSGQPYTITGADIASPGLPYEAFDPAPYDAMFNDAGPSDGGSVDNEGAADASGGWGWW